MALSFLATGFGTLASLLRWLSAEPRTVQRFDAYSFTPIADATEGAVVKVRGRVVLADGSGLEAPLTGRRCAAYKVVIRADRTLNEKADPGDTRIDEKAVEFFVEDESGRALVKAVGAKLLLVRDAHDVSYAYKAPNARVRAYAERQRDVGARALPRSQDLHYQEGVLEPGEEVTLLGQARWELEPLDPIRAGYREAPRRLVMHAPESEAMLITDDPSKLK